MIDMAELRAALEAGAVLTATRRDEQASVPMSTTIVVRRLPDGRFHLVVDRYRLDSPWGTDVEDRRSSFDDLEALVWTVEAEGFQVSLLRRLQ